MSNNGWFDQKHIERPNTIKEVCFVCETSFWVPKCKEGVYKTCSSECGNKRKDINKEKRKRNCLECKKVFYPRQTQINSGQGKYCSTKCSLPSRIAPSHTEEANKKRSESFRKSITDGTYKLRRGEDNPKWKGGIKATRERCRKGGERYEKKMKYMREYRKKNPDFMRESCHKRRSGIRMPRGTYKKIGDSQNWICVYCKKDIKDSYHVDHIWPLGKGGKHEISNLQLLCPTCNVRKWMKDPKEFAKEFET